MLMTIVYRMFHHAISAPRQWVTDGCHVIWRWCSVSRWWLARSTWWLWHSMHFYSHFVSCLAHGEGGPMMIPFSCVVHSLFWGTYSHGGTFDNEADDTRTSAYIIPTRKSTSIHKMTTKNYKYSLRMNCCGISRSSGASHWPTGRINHQPMISYRPPHTPYERN